MEENIKTLTYCHHCDEMYDMWEDVTDVWQKDGYNHYTSRCTNCGKRSTVSIKIEDEDY